MIEMDQMRDFVSNDRTPDKIRGLDEPPVEPQHAFGRATAPSALGPGQFHIGAIKVAACAILRRILAE